MADGEKSEVLVPPATLVALVALSIFVAFSFRNTVTNLAAERRQEAESTALALARELAEGSQISATQRYAHLADDPVRGANEQIDATLEATMAGAPKAEVVSIGRG